MNFVGAAWRIPSCGCPELIIAFVQQDHSLKIFEPIDEIDVASDLEFLKSGFVEFRRR